jgi:hypothetical protein
MLEIVIGGRWYREMKGCTRESEKAISAPDPFPAIFPVF